MTGTHPEAPGAYPELKANDCDQVPALAAPAGRVLAAGAARAGALPVRLAAAPARSGWWASPWTASSRCSRPSSCCPRACCGARRAPEAGRQLGVTAPPGRADEPRPRDGSAGGRPAAGAAAARVPRWGAGWRGPGDRGPGRRPGAAGAPALASARPRTSSTASSARGLEAHDAGQGRLDRPPAGRAAGTTSSAAPGPG